MRDLKIHFIVVKKFEYYCEKVVSDEKDNLINHDFKITLIYQKWCTISLIFTPKKWMDISCLSYGFT